MRVATPRPLAVPFRPLHSRMTGRGGKKARTVASASRVIEDKRVLVVGASRGIGLEFVKQFVAKGNAVHATVRGEGGEELRSLHGKAGGVAIGSLDVSDPASIQKWAATLDQPFDVAIYNAGVVDDWADLDEVDADRMLHCFKVNTIGAVLVAQSLVAGGLLQRGSLLANMTSKMGSVADNGSGGSYAYRASKAALNVATKSLAVDLASAGITVTLLHPGFVRTQMVRFSGLIDPDESVAGLISLLESDLPLHGRWHDYKKEEIPW